MLCYRLRTFPAVAVFAPLVVLVFRYERGLNIHAQIGEVIENADNRVAELNREPLGFARAIPVRLVARLRVFASRPGKAATTVNNRVSVPIFLESLGNLRMNERGNLGKTALSALPPTVSDGVFVYVFRKFVYCYSFCLRFRFGFINTPSRR